MERQPQIYICPMHPNMMNDKSGLCPECGMNLMPLKRQVGKAHHVCHNGHGGKNENGPRDKHADHKTQNLLLKFWIISMLTIPILAYSELAEKVFGWNAPRFPGSRFLILALGSVIFFYGGWVFIGSAWRELKARLPGMMTLIALAITAAYGFSLFTILAGREDTLFWELGTLIAVMLLGHWIEMRAVRGAQGALKELAKLLPDTAEVVRGGAVVNVPLAELHAGDVVLVKPGAKVPADGKVLEGRSELNESIMTGESKPVTKKEGDEVIAGSINGDGALKISVTKIGETTFLAGVIRLVVEAQASKSRLQTLSDRAALYLTALAVASGSATFVFWLITKAGMVFAIERLVAVLVIACPHALGLAIPLVASISTSLAARNGFLIRNRLALEMARKVDTVLFDKTGTLTKGEFGIDAIIPMRVGGEDETLRLAASVNGHSEHPIAKAIIAAASRKGLKLAEVKNFERIAGKGACGSIEDMMVLVGNERLLEDKKINLPPEHEAKTHELSKQGKTVIHVIARGKLAGSIALADVIREESREAIQTLKKLGVKVTMLTGDSEDVAKWVSAELGIDEYFAKVIPSEKVEKVKLLQSKGAKVAVVGDGVNDAPALTQADIGIAIGAGTNVAIESAGIILVKNDPRDIPKIIRLSGFTYRKMIENLFWATAYNIVALPLAAGALASKGIVLQPALAAVFMSLSTVIVALNALILRKRVL